ncbi:tetratricopeptide repeat protein [uncultured Brachyspira sp.]|uniref:tetratricopeptide repeat protein n=1 Tax=uncultured Brachyspira sp. TaxID=221953 RepID=UPI0025E5B392|nr:tetratricopeptide repeat protein [uncultured Brachyspira sp.]
MRVLLCSSMLIMLYAFSAASAQETITVQPDNQVVTNAASARIKGGPIESDLIKTADLSENTLFSIKLNAANFDRYIRITSYSTNLDFIRFTRDKTNAFLTFRTLTAGIGKLNFQVDNEESIIRKYLYTINVTNNMNMDSAETNTVLDPENETNNIMMTNDKDSNNTEANQTVNTNNTQSSVIKKNTQSKTQIQSDPNALALFKSAEELKNIKDYNNALKAYSNIINEYPNSKYSIYSHFRIGDIYNQKKDYGNAFNIYNEIPKLKDAGINEKAAAVYSMGVIKKSENKHEEAIEYFNDVINKYPQSSAYGNAAYELADSLKQIGKISNGLSILEKSLEKKEQFSKRGDSILLLAEIYEKGDNNTRNFEKAYKTYNQYLTEYPASSKAKYANDRKNFLSRNAVHIQ